MDFVTFSGNASDPPLITGHDKAADGAGGTYATATVGINGDYFMAINVKFEVSTYHILLNCIITFNIFY